MNIKYCELKDVATWERAKAGKVYQIGCSILQISATKGGIFYLGKPQEVESKYVVIMPNDDIEPFYFNIVLKRNVNKFLYAYKSGLNIQENDVGHYPIDLHDYDKQVEIAKVVKEMDTKTDQIETRTNILMNIKANMLSGMFI